MQSSSSTASSHSDQRSMPTGTYASGWKSVRSSRYHAVSNAIVPERVTQLPLYTETAISPPNCYTSRRPTRSLGPTSSSTIRTLIGPVSCESSDQTRRHCGAASFSLRIDLSRSVGCPLPRRSRCGLFWRTRTGPGRSGRKWPIQQTSAIGAPARRPEMTRSCLAAPAGKSGERTKGPRLKKGNAAGFAPSPRTGDARWPTDQPAAASRLRVLATAAPCVWS